MLNRSLNTGVTIVVTAWDAVHSQHLCDLLLLRLHERSQQTALAQHTRRFTERCTVVRHQKQAELARDHVETGVLSNGETHGQKECQAGFSADCLSDHAKIARDDLIAGVLSEETGF